MIKSEGSRGGRIVGHTKSGRAIYAAKKALKEAKTYHGEGTRPHLQLMSDYHRHMAQHHADTGNKPEAERHKKLSTIYAETANSSTGTRGYFPVPGSPKHKKLMSEHAKKVGGVKMSKSDDLGIDEIFKSCGDDLDVKKSRVRVSSESLSMSASGGGDNEKPDYAKDNKDGVPGHKRSPNSKKETVSRPGKGVAARTRATENLRRSEAESMSSSMADEDMDKSMCACGNKMDKGMKKCAACMKKSDAEMSGETTMTKCMCGKSMKKGMKRCESCMKKALEQPFQFSNSLTGHANDDDVAKSYAESVGIPKDRLDDIFG